MVALRSSARWAGGVPRGGQAAGKEMNGIPCPWLLEEIKWFGDLLPLQRSANPS